VRDYQGFTSYYSDHFLLGSSSRVDKSSNRDVKQDEQEPTCTKIYYASRTHSQLSQILPELSKLRLHSQPSTVVPVVPNTYSSEPRSSGGKRLNSEISTNDEPHPQWRTVSLGSRKQLCINGELRAKRGDLDEKCRELLGGGNVNSLHCSWMCYFEKTKSLTSSHRKEG
jgi:chromosome transmission fidelity protein 1